MAKLDLYTVDEVLNIQNAGGDAVFYHNNGDGSMRSVDVTNYKKVQIQFGNAAPGVLTAGVQYYGLSFSRNVAETWTLPNSGTLPFELNFGLVEISIPTHIEGVKVDRSKGDTIYMNFRGYADASFAYSYWLI